MRITPYNQITEDVTITQSSQVVEYPNSNLLDTYASQVVKFTGHTDENMVFYKSDYFAFNSIGIVNHNFTASVTVTLEANTSDSWGAPPYQETLTYREYLMYDFVTAVALTDTYDYVRLRIQDATNTEALQFGIVMLGTYLQLPGFGYDVTINDINYATANISVSGQLGGASRYTGREITVNMNDFSNAQRLAIRTLLETNGNYIPSIGVLWESDFTKEPPLYCQTKGETNTRQNDNQMNYYSASFTLREVF